MVKVEGIVEHTSSKDRNTRNGVLPVFSAKLDDGQWYDFGFKNPNLNSGDSVSIEYEDTQWGKKVKTHMKQGVASSVPTSNAGGNRAVSGGMDRQKSIVRQTCLKVSGEVIAAAIGKTFFTKSDDLADAVLAIARKLEKYALVEEPEDDPDFDHSKREAILDSLTSGTDADKDD